tara:strand:+ start:135 stop:470 length:336 start_codon:yes stop_codon:yes gene_type:complete
MPLRINRMNCFFQCPRGCPKTFDREYIIDVAMQTCWQDGAVSVSVNEICKIGKVSKPELYCGFKNKDALIVAALSCYEEKVLKPLFEMLNADQPFKEALNQLTHSVTQTVV